MYIFFIIYIMVIVMLILNMFSYTLQTYKIQFKIKILCFLRHLFVIQLCFYVYGGGFIGGGGGPGSLKLPEADIYNIHILPISCVFIKIKIIHLKYILVFRNPHRRKILKIHHCMYIGIILLCDYLVLSLEDKTLLKFQLMYVSSIMCC